ncbi:MAG TPA: hypothetical protein PK537_09915 [Candidatus Limiplasma sp.]|nr:hypothetical protein [Candidatus Limiplasma sp.]
MNNYIDLGEGKVQLPFGVLSGITTMDSRTDGSLSSVSLREKNVIVTHAGDLYAAYTETPRRKHKPSVEFYENGLVKAVALEEQQEVLSPIGGLPAELVTFYKSGELHRVFPVDGMISGFWTEEEERNMNIPLTFDLGFTTFTALLNSICFYKSGNIRSVTLYPDETVPVQTPFGDCTVRHGFSLYESGNLRSFEPASPVSIQTPIGKMVAYDPLGVGISADSGSVVLSDSGNLLEMKTAANRILVQTAGGTLNWYAPVQIPHPCSDEMPYYQPMRLQFDHGTVIITDDQPHAYDLADCHFHVSAFSDGSFGCSPADCASCSFCKK